jgi:hypothetical protein
MANTEVTTVIKAIIKIKVLKTELLSSRDENFQCIPVEKEILKILKIIQIFKFLDNHFLIFIIIYTLIT